MIYQLRIPDLSVHDDRTCGGVGHCTVANKRETWDAAYPLWRTANSELNAVRQVRERFPDAFPFPRHMKVAGEDTIGVYLLENEEAVRRSNMLKQKINPVCLVELKPETREERKLIKKKPVLDKALWFQGWIPALESVALERELSVRSSMRVGPTNLKVQVGKNADGQWELQIPTAFSIVLPDELVEEIGKLSR